MSIKHFPPAFSLRRSRRLNQAGATMIEFSLACIILVMLIGVLIDFGMGFHNYMLLRLEAEKAAREVVTRFNTRGECDGIRTYLDTTATNELLNSLGADATNGLAWQIQWLSQACGTSATAIAGAYPVLRVTARMNVSCYFLCRMFPDGLNLTATGEAVVERADTQCCTVN